jgi:SAM-dependent methyltransferase
LRRLFKRLKARWGPAFQSDTAFIEAAFREILGRNADLDGLTHYRQVLQQGLGRTAVLLDIMRSEEFRAKLQPITSSLPDLRALKPAQFGRAIDRTNGESIPVFEATSAADFDWLEHAIVNHGYYEKPGVWVLDVDADKRVIAEILAAFAPARALELGCAAGAVLQCLLEYGVVAEGVEISEMAIARAPEDVRGRIHHGDLLSLDLGEFAASADQPHGYDLIFGLDVFEHLNPNRLDAYIARLEDLVEAGGFLFCNIPAFGADPVFGTVFPLYIDRWRRDADAGRPFSTLHVDDLGYPIHGHLAWADAKWWSGRFERQGFQREIEIERALHAKYDRHMQLRSPARCAYFVFSKGNPGSRREDVIRQITGGRSRVTS